MSERLARVELVVPGVDPGDAGPLYDMLVATVDEFFAMKSEFVAIKFEVNKVLAEPPEAECGHGSSTSAESGVGRSSDESVSYGGGMVGGEPSGLEAEIAGLVDEIDVAILRAVLTKLQATAGVGTKNNLGEAVSAYAEWLMLSGVT